MNIWQTTSSNSNNDEWWWLIPAADPSNNSSTCWRVNVNEWGCMISNTRIRSCSSTLNILYHNDIKLGDRHETVCSWRDVYQCDVHRVSPMLIRSPARICAPKWLANANRSMYYAHPFLSYHYIKSYDHTRCIITSMIRLPWSNNVSTSGGVISRPNSIFPSPFYYRPFITPLMISIVTNTVLYQIIIHTFAFGGPETFG